MRTTLHVLDPDGDIIFVLRTLTEQKPLSSDDEAALKKAPEPEQSATPKASVASERLAIIEEPATLGKEPNRSSDDIGKQEIRMRVSSKHLRLASPYFDKMFSSGWLESKTMYEEGRIVLVLQNGEDPTALLILLNILHGHTRKVPRKVDLEMLTEFAVLVDYYDCHEAVEVFSDMWIDQLKTALPKTCSDELIQWLCISWIFRKKTEFGALTKIAQRQCKDSVESRGLPIPHPIIDKINERRQESIQRIISQLDDIVEGYKGDKIRCCFECDSIMLGAVIKHSKSQGLLFPRPKLPFPGLSYESAVAHLKSFRIPKWYADNSPYGSPHRCGFQDRVALAVEIPKEYFCGLDLDTFLPPKMRHKPTSNDSAEKQT